MNFKSQNFSTTFLPNPSILKASFETKCLIFSIAIFSHLYPSLEHLCTASYFFEILLKSLITLEPHEGQFFGNKNFFDSFGLFLNLPKVRVESHHLLFQL